MKKYYRKKLISFSLLAFLILLVLVIGGVLLFSYLQTDRNTDRTVQFLLEAPQEGMVPGFESPLPGFGNAGMMQRGFLSAYYDIRTDASGGIRSSEFRGFMENTGIDLETMTGQIIRKGNEIGRLNAYKYGMQALEDGGYHIILMDISIQMQMLFSVLYSSLIIGAVLLLLLFIILLPVSSRAAEVMIHNTEKQKQFITDAGHELKTPVAVIRSNLDVMELLQGSSKWSGNIRAQTDRLESLIRQLLLLARLDEKQWTGKTEKLDFSELTEGELAVYQESIQQKELELKTRIAPGIHVNGDRDSLRQMLHAVMDNAVLYTPEHGSILLCAETGRKGLRLEITNTADALPETAPEQLTERFVRGDTSRSRKSGGTGIGLSTARSVAEMHHGTLTVSYPDDSSFRVSIQIPSVGA